VALLFKPQPKQDGGIVALQTQTEGVPPDVVQGTLHGIDEGPSGPTVMLLL